MKIRKKYVYNKAMSNKKSVIENIERQRRVINVKISVRLSSWNINNIALVQSNRIRPENLFVFVLWQVKLKNSEIQ